MRITKLFKFILLLSAGFLFLGAGPGPGPDNYDISVPESSGVMYWQCNDRTEYDCATSPLLAMPDQAEMQNWLEARCYEQLDWKHDTYIR